MLGVRLYGYSKTVEEDASCKYGTLFRHSLLAYGLQIGKHSCKGSERETGPLVPPNVYCGEQTRSLVPNFSLSVL
jgi:hypothetical protein